MSFQEMKNKAVGRITAGELSKKLVDGLLDSSNAAIDAKLNPAKAEITSAYQEADAALGESIDGVEAKANAARDDLAAHKSAYEQKVQQLTQKDEQLEGEINKLKQTVSGKNNANKVFDLMEEFTAYAEGSVDSLIPGDIAYVLEVKRAYIYNPEQDGPTLFVDDTPPEGWIFLDEITSDVDLAGLRQEIETAKQAAIQHSNQKDTETLAAAKQHTNTEFGKVDGKIDAKLNPVAAKVTALETKVDVAKVSEAIEEAVAPVRTKANANEAAITKLNANAETNGSVDFKIKQAKTALEGQISGLGGRIGTLEGEMDAAQASILEHAEQIAELTAKKYILTRKQELLDTVSGQTEYELTTSVPENCIIDVFVNSVRLIEGPEKDYEIAGQTLTLKAARAEGGVIQVLFTFNANGPVE